MGPIFNFRISFCPGSKNGMEDALSHCFAIPEPEGVPGYIFPTSLIAAPIEWDLDEEIAQETQTHFAPQGCPPGRT